MTHPTTGADTPPPMALTSPEPAPEPPTAPTARPAPEVAAAPGPQAAAVRTAPEGPASEAALEPEPPMVPAVPSAPEAVAPLEPEPPTAPAPRTAPDAVIAPEPPTASAAVAALEPEPPTVPAAPIAPGDPAAPELPTVKDDLTVSDGPAEAGDDASAPPAGLWDKMKADPQYAPEHLALEAVRRLGPEAHEWGMRTRAQRPGIPPDALADLAIKRFRNLARLSGAAAGATGIAGAVVDVGVLAWNQARMVLHMAAAYGVDPRDPERATDLLVLQRVHKVAETARLALGVAAGREKAGTLLSGSGAPMHRVLAKLGIKLAQMAGIRAAKRIFAKIIPGAAIILGTWANSSATTDLANRTRDLYRPRAAFWPTQRGS